MASHEDYAGADCHFLVDPSDPEAEQKRYTTGVLALADELSQHYPVQTRVDYLTGYVKQHTPKPPTSPQKTYPEDRSLPD